MKSIKVIVEKHPDGYVAYPLGIKGVVVGEGDTYEEALEDVKSAIHFHVESFGESVLETDPPILDAFIVETRIEASTLRTICQQAGISREEFLKAYEKQ